MTTPYLLANLEADEGLRLKAYPDPRSGGAPWTIGYGHTGKEVVPGLVWTLAQAKTALITDVLTVKSQLDHLFAWWRKLSDVRQDALVNMTFNIGIGRLREFEHMLTALQRGDFVAASAEMLDSAWAKELPKRADRLAGWVRSGELSTQTA